MWIDGKVVNWDFHIKWVPNRDFNSKGMPKRDSFKKECPIGTSNQKLPNRDLEKGSAPNGPFQSAKNPTRINQPEI